MLVIIPLTTVIVLPSLLVNDPVAPANHFTPLSHVSVDGAEGLAIVLVQNASSSTITRFPVVTVPYGSHTSG